MKSSSPPPQSAHTIQVEKGCSQHQLFPRTSPVSLKCLCYQQHYSPGQGTRLFLPQCLHPKSSKILPFFHQFNRSPTCLLSAIVITVCNGNSTNHFLFRNNHRIPKWQSQKGPCRVSVVHLHPFLKGKAQRREENDLRPSSSSNEYISLPRIF